MVTRWILHVISIFLLAALLTGCGSAPASKPTAIAMPASSTITTSSSPIPTSTQPIPTPTTEFSKYAFPVSIDPGGHYLFYLHGKIIEDQGLPAVSPDYGAYQYQAILEKLAGYGFIVISEVRAKNTDGMEYAKRIAGQVTALLTAGVPAQNITLIGASKGAGIAILVSNLLENQQLNFVIMAICEPDFVEESIHNNTVLYGNILSIYDSTDELAGSCQDLFAFSEGKGISRHDEVVLQVGSGHGILFKPLDEWVLPAVEWAGIP